MKTYDIDLCGKLLQLPVMDIGNGISIAFFNLHGNQELTEFCAEKLSAKIPPCDIILTAESKGLQLAHCIARNLGHPLYAVARKSKKLYMQDGVESDAMSITTDGTQKLYLSSHDMALIQGKRVTIVDDVLSTGGSLRAMESLVALAHGVIVGRAFVLAEGEAKHRTDIVYLGTIPLL